MPTMSFSLDRHRGNRQEKRQARRLPAALLGLTAHLVLFSATGTTLTWANDNPSSPYAATLRKHGIEPDASGLGKYLRRVLPDEEQQREIKRWIEQLGSDRFTIRESATRRLMALPFPPIKALRLAANSDDPEVRFRVRRILAVDKSQRLLSMYAVVKTIEQEKIPGLTAELSRAAALCDEHYLSLAIRAAVQATARPDDGALLRKATHDENKEVVVAAIGGLGAALGTRARDDLRRLMEHKTAEVRLAAARALADQGDRASLAQLVKLLEATPLEVRIGAVRTLRQVTRTRHDFLAYEDESVRKAATTRWADWVASTGRTAELHFPLKPVRLELGRTLITLAGQNKVIELDFRGKLTWETTRLRNPWGCTGLSNAHRLISSRDGRSVVEYDASGKEIWRKEGLPEGPINVQRLDNGNTLIAFFVGQKVMEIRPDGTTAWEIAIKGGPVDVRRLDGGRTLVTLHQPHGQVVELDRAGKVRWEIKGLNMPMTGQRLDNGNTLVAEYGAGRVAEWDRGGKIVWQLTGLQHPYSAERLRNGNTLIAHRSDVREVDGRGKVLWEKRLTDARHATRF